MTRQLILDYVAPIPVGHRVEVEVLQVVEVGIFSERVEARPHHPWLRDVETGIEYTAYWHHAEVSGIRFKPGNVYPEGRIPDVRVAERLRGRVVACRLVTERISDSWQVQTYLTISPE